MGIFRPAAKVVAPDGRTWELYAYRFRLTERAASWDPDLAGAAVPQSGARAAASVLDGILWLLGLVARLFVRVLWEAPRAAVRTIGSDEWTVEAVCWLPRRERYTWRTSGEFRGNVLAQLEGQLARGESPRLAHATYLGPAR